MSVDEASPLSVSGGEIVEANQGESEVGNFFLDNCSNFLITTISSAFQNLIHTIY